MRRQLDPKIFPNSEYIQSSNKNEEKIALQNKKIDFKTEQLDFAQQEQAHTQSLRDRISDLKDNQEKEKTKMLIQALVEKMQVLEMKFAKLAEPVLENQKNLRDKMISLEQRVSDRSIVDNRTQALIDRHQIIVRQFEQDMQKMRSLIEEKEMQNAYLNNVLRDARQEIERLKKL